VKVKDRFGDYGLVGLLIVQPDAESLVVDTLLLSCRVLGRGVEHRMLNHLAERARSDGMSRVDVRFVRSKKNQPVFDFLESVAGKYRDGDAETRSYRIPVDVAAAAKPSAGSSAAEASEISDLNLRFEISGSGHRCYREQQRSVPGDRIAPEQRSGDPR
jgi:hypothetical protein